MALMVGAESTARELSFGTKMSLIGREMREIRGLEGLVKKS